MTDIEGVLPVLKGCRVVDRRENPSGKYRFVIRLSYSDGLRAFEEELDAMHVPHVPPPSKKRRKYTGDGFEIDVRTPLLGNPGGIFLSMEERHRSFYETFGI